MKNLFTKKNNESKNKSIANFQIDEKATMLHNKDLIKIKGGRVPIEEKSEF